MGEGDDKAPADDSLIAAGGWIAPSELLYDATRLDTNMFTALGFPEIRVSRVVPNWFEPPTPAEARAQSAVQALTLRLANRMAKSRHAAIDAACVTALAEGWDVHVYEPPEPYSLHRAKDNDLLPMAYVGIEFTPALHPVPVVHYHQEHLDEFDWDED